jgi:hypothetical protein
MGGTLCNYCTQNRHEIPNELKKQSFLLFAVKKSLIPRSHQTSGTGVTPVPRRRNSHGLKKSAAQ